MAGVGVDVEKRRVVRGRVEAVTEVLRKADCPSIRERREDAIAIISDQIGWM